MLGCMEERRRSGLQDEASLRQPVKRPFVPPLIRVNEAFVEGEFRDGPVRVNIDGRST